MENGPDCAKNALIWIKPVNRSPSAKENNRATASLEVYFKLRQPLDPVKIALRDAYQNLLAANSPGINLAQSCDQARESALTVPE
jgi:hypothetical protein